MTTAAAAVWLEYMMGCMYTMMRRRRGVRFVHGGS